MQELGNFIARLGPSFGFLLLVLGIATGLALLWISIPRRLHR